VPETIATGTDGGAVPIAAAKVEALAAALDGDLLRPDHPQYDAARRVWNGMFDRRPALIARCRSEADVVQSVRFAREHGLLLSVRGGGHSLPGHSVCAGGLMVDLSPMKGVQVEAERRVAWAGPGLVWGELDAATQAHGLAVTGGQVSHTGVAGLTLGGGMGWLMRRYGLTCDNLVGARLVTAEGEAITADDENGELLWGLRGGSGNFGVVTAFRFGLHPVGPQVVGGLLAFPFPETRQVLRAFREFAEAAPDELTCTVAFLTTPEGQKALGIGVCYAGDLAQGERAVAPLREMGTVVMDQVGRVPYTAVQSMLDETMPHGSRYYVKATMLSALGDGAIEVCAEQFARVPSPLTQVLLVQTGGQVSRQAPDATAFAHRQAAYNFVALSQWRHPGEDRANIDWTRAFHEALEPYSSHGVYVNDLMDEGRERVQEAYGPTYRRLAALKARYDPTNFFRLNQNIRPATGQE
jgi:FAD/FMN-containing dehydrogenase